MVDGEYSFSVLFLRRRAPVAGLYGRSDLTDWNWIDDMAMGLLIDIFCPTGWWMGSTRFLFSFFGAGPPSPGSTAAPVDPSEHPLKTRANRLQFHWPKCTPNTREPRVSLPSIGILCCKGAPKGCSTLS